MQRFWATLVISFSLIFTLASSTSALVTSASLSFTRSLSLGVSGSDVSQLQQFLKEQGFYTYSEITGYFGQITKQAVIDFQEAYSINPIGIVGPQTQAKITSLSSDSTTSNSPDTSELRSAVTRQSNADSARSSINLSDLSTTLNASITSNATQWTSGTGGIISYTGGNVGIGTTTPPARLSILSPGETNTLGSELVVNGAFTSDLSSWTAGSDWTWDSGTAKSSASAYNPLSQSISLTAGQTYAISFDIGGGGDIDLYIGTPGSGDYSGQSISYSYVDGTHNTSYTATTTKSYSFEFYSYTANTTLDNVSVKTVTSDNSVLTLSNSDHTTALEFRTGGSTLDNTFIGINSGSYNITGLSNTSLGVNALERNVTGSYNTAIGRYALASSTAGSYNTAVGYGSLLNNIAGSNSALGSYALYSNTTGIYNSALGRSALQNNTTGDSNSALGNYALYSNTTGIYNSALGAQALYFNTTGNYNTAIGRAALYYNTTASFNTAIGHYTLVFNTTGSSNSALGHTALQTNTTGSSNTALGNSALYVNTTGSYNTAVGQTALTSNRTGSNNSALGYYALRYNGSATNTVAVGYQAARGTAAYNNQGGTYLGYQAGYSAGTGSDYNTLLGYQAGYGITTGKNNIWVGTATSSTAIANLTTGSQNILIGSNISLPSATASGQLNIQNIIFGTGNTATGANVSTGNVGIGTTSPWRILSVAGTVGFSSSLGTGVGGNYLCIDTTTFEILRGNGTACTASSLRFKDNVADMTYGLNEVMALRPVSFTYKLESNMGEGTKLGFIAEEMYSVMPEVVSLDSEGEVFGLDYPVLTSVLTRAIQELNFKVENLISSSSTSTIAVTDGSGIIDTLLYAGMRLFQDSVKFVEVVAERIITNEIRTKTIQITDEDTGEEYCVRMKSGTLVSTLGKCSGTNITPPEAEPNIPDAPVEPEVGTPTPEDVGAEPTPEPTPEPTQDLEPIPTLEPEPTPPPSETP